MLEPITVKEMMDNIVLTDYYADVALFRETLREDYQGHIFGDIAAWATDVRRTINEDGNSVWYIDPDVRDAAEKTLRLFEGLGIEPTLMLETRDRLVASKGGW